MIPFGNKTVTLLHKGDAGYTKHVLTGCSWRMAESKTLENNSTVYRAEITCRIPHTQQMPCTGDLLVLGDVDIAADGEIALVRLLGTLKDAGIPAFRAQRVMNNAQGAPLPHYAASGE